MKAKCSFLAKFFKDLNNSNKLKTQKEKTKKKKIIVYDAASKLSNELLETYFDEYNELQMLRGKNIELKYDPTNLFLKTYNFDPWFENEESTNREEFVDLSDMQPLEGDEKEVKEGKGLKILTPNKLLTRLPTLPAQIKAGNNSDKLKNEIRQILYLLY